MPKPFTRLTAIAAPIMRSNIDTDVIIRIERLVGNSIRGTLGKWAFGSLRYLPDGSENPEFILNREPYRQAEILVTGPNFGCGSSREGAVWSLQEMGIRAVIGSTFVFLAIGFLALIAIVGMTFWLGERAQSYFDRAIAARDTTST